MKGRRLGGYLKPWEASRYLGIPFEEIYQLLQSDELPGVQIDGQWRVSLEKLEEWLDEDVSQKELKHLAGHLKGADPKKIKQLLQQVDSPSDNS